MARVHDPLLPSDGVRRRKELRFLAFAVCVAAAVCLAGVGLSLRRGEGRGAMLSVDDKVAEMAREASLVKAENEKLAREDSEMSEEKSLMERSLLEQSKAEKLKREKQRQEVLKMQNAKLSLENQVLRHKMLLRKMTDEKRQLAGMHQLQELQKEISKATEGFERSMDHGGRVGPALARLDSDEGVMDIDGGELDSKFKMMMDKQHRLTGLVGNYIARCQPGHGCEKFYDPENSTHYDEANHTIIVTSNGIGWPLGPTERVPTTYTMKSVHDIVPKEGRVPDLGDGKKQASLGSHWVTYGAKDAFVPFEQTKLNPRQWRLLPPWTRHIMEKKWGMTYAEKAEKEEDEEVKTLEQVNASDIHGSCPGDPTGRSCLTGSTGVDGVHEWSLLNHGKSTSTRWLETHGVNVGNWGIPGIPGEKHKWNRKGEDNPPNATEEVEWDQMKTPQWSWNNAAMRSQGWDPEGVKNRQLLLGAGYGENITQSDVMDDQYVNEAGYSGQVQVRAPDHPHNDHFADWEPKGEKNVKLVYGESAITNDLRWSIKNRKWVKTQWGYGDRHVAAADAAAELGVMGPRSGEPISDLVTAGWSGANGVGANHYDLEDVKNTTEAYPENTKLRNLGVNIDGSFDK